MNLSAIQLVHPIDPERGTLRVIAGRVGRIALLYAALAAAGATLAFFASLLTWENVTIAALGLILGIGAIHSATAFMDVLVLLIQHMRGEFRAITRIMADLRAESRTMVRELGTHNLRPDDTQPLCPPESVLRRNVLKYASLIAMIAPAFVVLAHVSAVFVWSGLSGLVFGIVVVVVDRVIFHIHGFDIRRKGRRTDVTSNR